jgi:Domain of unknown function (DUF3846)
MTPTDTTDLLGPGPVAALWIDVDGTVTRLADASSHSLHDGVGGLIEAVPGDGTYTLWVRETGKLDQLPPNPLGDGLWYLIDVYDCLAAGDWIAGPCVITGPVSDDGDVEAVDDTLALTICLMSRAVRNHARPTAWTPHAGARP